MRVIRWAELAEQPWKNGGGTTREIWQQAGNDGAFDWRASVAAVSSPGPFSLFPGYDRIIMVLSAHGMQLRRNNAVYAELCPLAPVAFPGEAEVTAALPQGPVADFNFIVRRRPGRVAEIVLLQGDRGCPACLPEHTLLALVAAGSFTLGGNELAERDSFLRGAADPLSVEGSGVLACCCLKPD